MAQTRNQQNDPDQQNPSGRLRGGEMTRSGGQSSGEAEQRGLARLEGRGGAFGVPLNPFTFMRRFMEDLDQLFVDQSNPSQGGRQAQQMSRAWAPPVEVFQREGELVVRAEVPGLNTDQIQVEIEDDRLVLSGERREEHEEKREGFYSTERIYGRFYRVIPLPDGIEPEQAKATFTNGVLEVCMQLPRQQQSRSRRVEVQEGDRSQAGPAHIGSSRGGQQSSQGESSHSGYGGASGSDDSSRPQHGSTH